MDIRVLDRAKLQAGTRHGETGEWTDSQIVVHKADFQQVGHITDFLLLQTGIHDNY